ncbi:MAG: TfoX/Sxy family protein [Nocardioides sp.]
MAYDEDLAQRIRELVHELAEGEGPVEEKRMFGGLAFMVGGHMAVCASGQGDLMVRVGADDHSVLLRRDHVTAMVMGTRASRTWVRVAREGVRTKRQLQAWVTRGVATACALTPPD